MLNLRGLIAVGAGVLGAAAIFAAPAAAAPAPAPAPGGPTPGQCVMGGGYVEYDVTQFGESNGRGTCYEGRFDKQRLFDPSQPLPAPVVNNKGKPSTDSN